MTYLDNRALLRQQLDQQREVGERGWPVMFSGSGEPRRSDVRINDLYMDIDSGCVYRRSITGWSYDQSLDRVSPNTWPTAGELAPHEPGYEHFTKALMHLPDDPHTQLGKSYCHDDRFRHFGPLNQSVRRWWYGRERRKFRNGSYVRVRSGSSTPWAQRLGIVLLPIDAQNTPDMVEMILVGGAVGWEPESRAPGLESGLMIIGISVYDLELLDSDKGRAESAHWILHISRMNAQRRAIERTTREEERLLRGRNVPVIGNHHMRAGRGRPTSSMGDDGDYYYDSETQLLYGPRMMGRWPGNGVSLRGADGIIGPQGIPGPVGPPGMTGATGMQGPMGPRGDRGDQSVPGTPVEEVGMEPIEITSTQTISLQQVATKDEPRLHGGKRRIRVD